MLILCDLMSSSVRVVLLPRALSRTLRSDFSLRSSSIRLCIDYTHHNDNSLTNIANKKQKQTFTSDYMRLDSFLRRCVMLGYAGRSATVSDMFSQADDVFFRRIPYNKTHVLHSYLPDRPKIVYALRTRSRNKSLICKSSDLNDRNFLVRAIYKDSY